MSLCRWSFMAQFMRTTDRWIVPDPFVVYLGQSFSGRKPGGIGRAALPLRAGLSRVSPTPKRRDELTCVRMMRRTPPAASKRPGCLPNVRRWCEQQRTAVDGLRSVQPVRSTTRPAGRQYHRLHVTLHRYWRRRRVLRQSWPVAPRPRRRACSVFYVREEQHEHAGQSCRHAARPPWTPNSPPPLTRDALGQMVGIEQTSNAGQARAADALPGAQRGRCTPCSVPNGDPARRTTSPSSSAAANMQAWVSRPGHPLRPAVYTHRRRSGASAAEEISAWLMRPRRSFVPTLVHR